MDKQFKYKYIFIAGKSQGTGFKFQYKSNWIWLECGIAHKLDHSNSAQFHKSSLDISTGYTG